MSDYVDTRLPVVARSSTLNDALDTMLAASQGGVLVTDGRGALVGALKIDSVMGIIQDQLSQAREHDTSYEEHARHRPHRDTDRRRDRQGVAPTDDPRAAP